VKDRLQNRLPPNPSLARIGEQIVLMKQRADPLAEVANQSTEFHLASQNIQWVDRPRGQ
jgi:hypothetical protein